MRKRQEEARRRLGAQASPSAAPVQKPAISAKDLNKTSTKETAQQTSRAERLAELRKQSQESVKKTESILEPNPVRVQPVAAEPTETVVSTVVDTDSVGEKVEIKDTPNPAEPSLSSKNVFKQIVTKTPKKKEHRRRRSRHDDSGGGRQPKVKKLNRQRYNDYKYAARDILEDDSIAEEHRSNLLGQIWAKGERIGVEATYQFIEEKQEQLIISDEVAKQLSDLVRALTTRR